MERWNLTFVDVLQPMASDSNVVSRATTLRSQLRTVSESLRILSSKVDKELDLADRCLRRLKPMCGLASLPNDVMVLIFDLVVSPNGKEEHLHSHRAGAALRLSYISRYFRNLVLSFPQLWNQINIYPHNSSELIEACIRWSRESPLDIHLSVFVDTPERDQYFDAFYQVLSQAHRWRKLTLHVFQHRSRRSQSRRQNLDIPPIVITSSDPGTLSESSFIAPLLEEIVVEKDASLPRSYVENLASGFLWQTPSLKVLEVSQYFPYDLTAISSIPTLDFTIGRTKFDYPRVLGVLRTMHALEDLRIRFEASDEERADEGVAFDTTVLTNVSRFTLRLETKHLSKPERASTQLAFYAALAFPNATELQIHFYGICLGRDRSNASIADDYLKHAAVQFPCLSSLHLDFRQRKHTIGTSLTVGQLVSPPIPLHYLRSLDRLIIQCKVPLT